MNSRSALNQVKIQVRQEALSRRVFTVADIVRATGLKPESVRTEMQRMKGQGMITSERQGKNCQYFLTDDPETRLALSQSLHVFYPPVVSGADYPTSDVYKQAQQHLDMAMNTAEDDCASLLQEAQALLAQAAQEEGHVSASESVLSYLGYERARLAYLLGKQAAAERSFQALRPFFAGIQDTEMVCYIDQFLLVIGKLTADKVTFANEGPGQDLREYLRQHHSRGPLLPRLVSMLDHAPQAANSMDITALNLNPAKEFLGAQLKSRSAALAA